MERTYLIEYQKDVIKKDIPKISNFNKTRIHKSINDKLTSRPEFFGKPLRESLKGYRSLRVGNYRVIFQIKIKKIKIFAIQKRAVAYKKILIQK